VEKLAKKGDKNRFPFPLPMTNTKTFDMSFSGLKTHSKRLIKNLIVEEKLTKQIINDFCACLQEGVFNHIIYKLEKLLAEVTVSELWLGGGVAANLILRTKLRTLAKSRQLTFRAPYSKKLTGDNAAMIAVTASYLLERKPKTSAKLLDRRPRWPVDSL
jgi:N6-L-threonylcarbamoyladenine synthase